MLPRVATIGFFDGVHKGHRYLMNELRFYAAQNWCDPLIVTFREHPRHVLQSPNTPLLLTLADERKALLEQYAEVLMLPFADVQPMTAAQFMRHLKDRYNVRLLLMGYDHRFGSDRLTDFADYKRIAAEIGVNVEKMNQYLETGLHVSSTVIRSLISGGDVESANMLLGRQYSLSGEIVHGNAIGHTIGFPTANLQVDSLKQVPAAGVYAGSAAVGDKEYKAVINIGSNPTIGNADQTIEAHLIDYDGGDLYGQTMTINLTRRIRDERKFDTIEELKAQITRDIDNILHPLSALQ